MQIQHSLQYLQFGWICINCERLVRKRMIQQTEPLELGRHRYGELLEVKFDELQIASATLGDLLIPPLDRRLVVDAGIGAQFRKAGNSAEQRIRTYDECRSNAGAVHAGQVERLVAQQNVRTNLSDLFGCARIRGRSPEEYKSVI